MGKVHIEIEIQEEGDNGNIGCAPDPGIGRAQGPDGRRMGLGDLSCGNVQSVNKFIVFYSNVDVFSHDKLNELKYRLKESQVSPHIIALQEVRPKNFRFQRMLVEYSLDGYEIVEKNVTHDREGRGMLVYVRKDMAYTEVTMEQKYCEYICIELKGLDEKILITSVYRSPSSDMDANDKLLNLIQELNNHRAKHKIILGDFNLPDINWENCTTTAGSNSMQFKFIETTRDCYLTQHITETTRQRGQSKGSVLDLLLSSEEEIVNNINLESPIGKSDHACITFTCSIGVEERVRNKTVYIYEKADYELLRQKLNIDWKEYLKEGTIEEKWLRFRAKYEEVIKECVPMREYKDKTNMRKRTNKYLPMNRKLWKKIRRKKRLWARLKQMSSSRDTNNREYHEVMQEYRQTNNQVRRETRKEIKNKESNIAQKAKTNPKLFWKYVQGKMNSRPGIPDLYTDSNKTTKTNSDKEKAEVLAKHFCEVFTDEPIGDIPHISPKNVQTMPAVEFSITKIKKVIRKLKVNKSPGPDKIHPRFLKEGAEQLAEPLKIIFEFSFNSGQIPEDWSLANITAIFKKGNKNEPGNYRPVSLTSVVCKLMETIVREDIMKHMKTKKLFSRKQFGFLPGRSTVLQLIKVIDQWTQILDEGDAVDIIYCDFMKAFDKVPHRRLLAKISSYKIGETCLKWIEAFLSNRRQCVIVNGQKSGWKEVRSGVPQGSVLGPLLFVLYINDLPEELNNGSEVYLYADDTKVYRHIKGQGDMEQLQEDINCMRKWSEKWLLLFHPKKCKFMRMGNYENRHDGYEMYEPLEEVAAEKDIGVIIDNKLSFSDHLAEKINKANRIMGLIRRTFIAMDEDIFRCLWVALVRPHLEYANQVWAPYLVKDVEAIENVQRRATKLIPTLKSLNYEERLRKLGLPTLAYRRARGDMIETYKILRGIYDEDVCHDIFVLQEDQRTRGHSKKIFKKMSRLNKSKNSFCNRVINNWNLLPPCAIASETVKEFEHNLDKAWKGQELYFNYKAKMQYQQILAHTDTTATIAAENTELDVQA